MSALFFSSVGMVEGLLGSLLMLGAGLVENGIVRKDLNAQLAAHPCAEYEGGIV